MSQPTLHHAGDVSFFEFAERLKAPKPLRRLFSLARHHKVATVLELPLELDDVSLREIALFEEADKRLERTRLLIALSLASREEVRAALPHVPKCVGYCILHTDDYVLDEGERFPLTFVAEAVLKPPKNVSGSRFLHCQRTFSVDQPDIKLSVTGAYFAQQSRISSCCAHASLLMGLRTMHKGHALDYLQINERLDLPIPAQKRADACGLSSRQIKEVLESQGVQVRNFAFKFDGHSGEKYAPDEEEAAEDRLDRHRDVSETFSAKRIVYNAVESGFPVLLSWETGPNRRDGHVFVVLGHVFDKHRWFAEAVQDYTALRPKERLDATSRTTADLQLASCAWTRDFIIADDNFGPYYSMSTGDLGKHQGLVRALVLTPEGVPFLAPGVEIMAMALADTLCKSETWSRAKLPVDDKNVWFRRTAHAAEEHRLIVRTIYADKTKYIARVQDSAHFVGPDQRSLDLIAERLPQKFWMAEVSLPELYPVNKARVGEILFVQDEEGANAFAVKPIGVRLPGFFAELNLVDDQGIEMKAIRTTLRDHYKLYRTRQSN